MLYLTGLPTVPRMENNRVEDIEEPRSSEGPIENWPIGESTQSFEEMEVRAEP